MITIDVTTHQHCQMVDVTGEVQRAVRESGLQNGYVICFVTHTTAGVTIQENADPDVTRDLLWKLEQLAPRNEPEYQHSEGNSDAHIKSSLVGCAQTILVADGRLVLGTWQAVYFCEFDGPRHRRMLAKCISD